MNFFEKFIKYKTLFIVLAIAFIVVFSIFAIQGKFFYKDFDFSSNYSIEAKINPDKRDFEYVQKAEIINNGKSSANVLYFNLYANSQLPENYKISVLSVKDEEGKKLSYNIIQGGNALKLKLNKPISSGQKAVIVFSCRSTLPDMTNFFGVAQDGEIHLPMFNLQLAVYDKKGWNCLKQYKNGDGRYSYISDFAVSFSAPKGYEVVCNGDEISRKNEKDETIFIFKSQQRRDLVITLHKNYFYLEKIVGKTKIKGYFNANRISKKYANRTIESAAFALKYYNEIYGEYPFKTFVITNSAKAVTKEIPVGYNMEYSGLIAIVVDENNREQVVFHETAHQWFYLLVGNDENTEAWLDEGFAVFSVNMCLRKKGEYEKADKMISLAKTKMNKFPKLSLLINPNEIDGEIYSCICYFKGSYFLEELKNAMGEKAFLEAVRIYLNEYKFKNATTDDFLQVIKQYSTKDVEPIILRYIN